MAATPISPAQRFTRARPCPVCGGHADLPHGKGVRCYGFLSSDGDYAHCTREDLAGGIAPDKDGQTYAHWLRGGCRCGQRHGEAAPPRLTVVRGTAREVARYPYRDAAGTELYHVRRYDPKDFRPYLPEAAFPGLGDARRVPYRLSELLTADPAAPVFVVEGEKDADALAARGLVATTSQGGAGQARQWEEDGFADALADRAVIILPDNDRDGRRFAELAGGGLARVAATVRVLALPGLPEKGDPSDWLAAGGTAAELLALADAASAPPAALPTLSADERHLPLIVPLAWEALGRANEPPSLFVFGGLPTRLVAERAGGPVTQPLDEDRLRFELARAANWETARKGGTVLTVPPTPVLRDMLAAPHPPLPLLELITVAPTFAPDGSVRVAAGYHPASRTYFAPAPGFAVPDVPDAPTARDIDCARALILDDLLGDFPLVGDSERAHAVGLLLLPFVRSLIDGATPLHLIEKPMPGTGASLLADMLIFPATGQEIAALTEGRDEDEWRKRITARLRLGAAAILFDNLRQRLETASVAAVLTATYWEDRLLGTSDTLRLPVRCAWIATGNNPALSSEIARRTIRIRLDARSDQPWLRAGFRHPNLREWAREERAALAWAALTLGRAWLAAGRPARPDAPRLGMFESWSRVIGGILDAAGIPGFLGNLGDFYDQADSEGRAIRALVAAWWSRLGGAAVGVADLYRIVADEGLDLDLGDKSERSQRIRLGRLLGELRDRQYRLPGDLIVRIAAAGTLFRAQQWQLAPVVAGQGTLEM